MKITGFLMVVSLFFVSHLHAAEAIRTGFFSNLAVKGYDVVTYFTQSQAVVGLKKYATEYKGAEWRFSKEENLHLFLKDPKKYEPQYGGHCAYAVAHGSTADIDPKAFFVYNGKLYLNYDADIQKKWENDKEKYIQQADKNWKELLK